MLLYTSLYLFSLSKFFLIDALTNLYYTLPNHLKWLSLLFFRFYWFSLTLLRSILTHPSQSQFNYTHFMNILLLNNPRFCIIHHSWSYRYPIEFALQLNRYSTITYTPYALFNFIHPALILGATSSPISSFLWKYLKRTK